jgi:hypothetical protein
MQRHIRENLGAETNSIYIGYTLWLQEPVTYAATVWWPRVKLKTRQAELSKLQRMARLGIIERKRTLTAAMEVPLGFPPLDLQLQAETKAGIYRLYCNDQWKPKSEGFGHAYINQDIKKEPILQMGTDKMIPRHGYDKPFTIRFPDRSEWKDRF